MEKTLQEEILKLKQIAATISNRRNEGKRLNRYEYYVLGGIPFRSAEGVVYKLYKSGELTTREATTLYNYIQHELAVGASKNKNVILGTHYQFGQRIITDEEKQTIWEGLINLGLSDSDIDDLVFSGAVRAYAEANGLIPSKKSTR